MIYHDMNVGNKPRALALGLFDSLHIGHLTIIRELVRVSAERGLVPTVQLFDNFDLKGIRMVRTVEERAEILSELGVQDIVVTDFTENIRNMRPQDYINDLVLGKMHAEYAIVGTDYHYGRMGLGDVKLLRELFENKGKAVTVLEPKLTEDGTAKISTSLVKNLLDLGEIEQVNSLLGGREFSYRGPITDGNRIGRTIGFPTINTEVPEDKYIIRRGVYLSRTVIDNHIFNSITNVGIKPTIEEKTKKVIIETHLYDFNRDVYGRSAEVKLLEFMREETKFTSINELQAQIREDKNMGYSRHMILGGKV